MLSREILFRFIEASNPGKHIRKLDSVISLLSKSVTINTPIGSLDFEALCDKLKKIKPQNIILCLDDFERCSIPIADLMGFINSLIEGYQYRVIILSDEDKIGKLHLNENVELKYIAMALMNKEKSATAADDIKIATDTLFREDLYYDFIKEKVICETVRYTPNKQDIIQSLVKGIDEDANPSSSESFKSHLEKMSPHIIKQLESIEKCNFRDVKRWLEKYKKVFYECRNQFASKECYEELINELREFSLICICKPDCLSDTSENHHKGMYKIGVNDIGKDLIAFDFLQDWMLDEEWDLELFIQTCKIRLEMIVNEKKSNRKGKYDDALMNWLLESDSEISEQIVGLQTEVQDDSYTWELYPRIIHDLLFFNKLDPSICGEELIESVVNSMIVNIEKAEKSEIVDPDLQMRVIYRFDNEEDKDKYYKYYNKVVESIKRRLVELGFNYIDPTAEKLDPTSFCRMCHEKYDYFYRRKSFLQWFGYKRVLNMIMDAELKDKRMILQSLKLIYRHESPEPLYKNDYNELVKLKKAIEERGFGTELAQRHAAKEYLDLLEYLIGRFND